MSYDSDYHGAFSVCAFGRVGVGGGSGRKELETGWRERLLHLSIYLSFLLLLRCTVHCKVLCPSSALVFWKSPMIIIISSVQISLVQDYIYVLRKAHVCSMSSQQFS